MTTQQYLPLGSIVIMKGSVKKIVIVARAVNVRVGEREVFFDYAACPYPEGMMGDQLMYFQHKDIMKVVFEGFSDDDDKIMVDNINRVLNEMDVCRLSVEDVMKAKR